MNFLHKISSSIESLSNKLGLNETLKELKTENTERSKINRFQELNNKIWEHLKHIEGFKKETFNDLNKELIGSYLEDFSEKETTLNNYGVYLSKTAQVVNFEDINYKITAVKSALNHLLIEDKNNGNSFYINNQKEWYNLEGEFAPISHTNSIGLENSNEDFVKLIDEIERKIIKSIYDKGIKNDFFDIDFNRKVKPFLESLLRNTGNYNNNWQNNIVKFDGYQLTLDNLTISLEIKDNSIEGFRYKDVINPKIDTYEDKLSYSIKVKNNDNFQVFKIKNIYNGNNKESFCEGDISKVCSSMKEFSNLFHTLESNIINEFKNENNNSLKKSFSIKN